MMKKVEVKEIKAVSAFKTTVYLVSVPMGILLVIGSLIALVSAMLRSGPGILVGILYMIMPLFMLAIYGALSMLVAIIYNFLANRFGGLELIIEEKIDHVVNYVEYHDEGEPVYHEHNENNI